MTNAEIIQAIRKEIERLESIEYPCDNSQQATGFFNALDRMTDFLSTLEAEEMILSFEEVDKCPKNTLPPSKECDHGLREPLESEKPMNPDDAMKELDEKIALVKQRGTWDGVDVDKYMDEVRGREPEKPMQKGLEEEINRYLEPIHTADIQFEPFTQMTKCARHFAEWQKQHDAELIEIAYNDGITIGMTKQKEQMMKEAVEGKVFMSFAPGHNQMVMADVDLPTNTKVRIIIVKEDEK